MRKITSWAFWIKVKKIDMWKRSRGSASVWDYYFTVRNFSKATTVAINVCEIIRAIMLKSVSEREAFLRVSCVAPGDLDRKASGTFCPPDNISHSSQSAHPLIALAHDSHYPVQLFREFNRTAHRRSRRSLSRDKRAMIVTPGRGYLPRRMIIMTIIVHRASIIIITETT